MPVSLVKLKAVFVRIVVQIRIEFQFSTWMDISSAIYLTLLH